MPHAPQGTAFRNLNLRLGRCRAQCLFRLIHSASCGFQPLPPPEGRSPHSPLTLPPDTGVCIYILFPRWSKRYKAICRERSISQNKQVVRLLTGHGINEEAQRLIGCSTKTVASFQSNGCTSIRPRARRRPAACRMLCIRGKYIKWRERKRVFSFAIFVFSLRPWMGYVHYWWVNRPRKRQAAINHRTDG